jgi:hypothetical protein
VLPFVAQNDIYFLTFWSMLPTCGSQPLEMTQSRHSHDFCMDFINSTHTTKSETPFCERKERNVSFVSNKEELFERRRHKRFQVTTGSCAYCRSCPDKVGQIIDVSRRGLTLSYVTHKDQLSSPLELDIVLPNGSVYLNKLPCRTISDFNTDDGTSIKFGTRRCGVEFGDLTDDQKFALNHFIQHYTEDGPKIL